VGDLILSTFPDGDLTTLCAGGEFDFSKSQIPTIPMPRRGIILIGALVSKTKNNNNYFRGVYYVSVQDDIFSNGFAVKSECLVIKSCCVIIH